MTGKERKVTSFLLEAKIALCRGNFKDCSICLDKAVYELCNCNVIQIKKWHITDITNLIKAGTKLELSSICLQDQEKSIIDEIERLKAEKKNVGRRIKSARIRLKNYRRCMKNGALLME